ncbi:hypothetical protein Leryth_018557 [Lithospermum erythrorhizon]|nr:hypothetical protein Leryth_018557 [Lithospermum erythrorhizon]
MEPLEEIPIGSEGGSSGSSSNGGDDKTTFKKTQKNGSKVVNSTTTEYSGWVYHVGVNSIGHEYCHLRFLLVRGKYVEMFKRDPAQNPGIKPIRRGAIGHTLMVEELGRRKEVYVIRFYNRLDETKKGEMHAEIKEEGFSQRAGRKIILFRVKRNVMVSLPKGCWKNGSLKIYESGL